MFSRCYGLNTSPGRQPNLCGAFLPALYTDIPVQVSKPVFMPAQSGLEVKIGL